jgi:hypothetical protein
LGKLNAKDFAKKFAGEYYLFQGKKARIVGYRKPGGKRPFKLIVSGLGSGYRYEDVKDLPDHVFTTRVWAKTIWYADIMDLKGYYPE